MDQATSATDLTAARIDTCLRETPQVFCFVGPIAYLSSPSLLNLQLQDVTFRRHHLVQIAMLLHFAITSRESPELQVHFLPSAGLQTNCAWRMLSRQLFHLDGFLILCSIANRRNTPGIALSFCTSSSPATQLYGNRTH
jgi:hypothetical protein